MEKLQVWGPLLAHLSLSSPARSPSESESTTNIYKPPTTPFHIVRLLLQHAKHIQLIEYKNLWTYGFNKTPKCRHPGISLPLIHAWSHQSFKKREKKLSRNVNLYFYISPSIFSILIRVLWYFHAKRAQTYFFQKFSANLLS